MRVGTQGFKRDQSMFRWPAGAAAELEVDGLGRFTMGMREGRPCAHWKGKAVAARRARRLAPCAGVRPEIGRAHV